MRAEDFAHMLRARPGCYAPAVQERLARLGVEGGTMGSDEFQKLLPADSDAAGAIVKASGARIEQGVAATM